MNIFDVQWTDFWATATRMSWYEVGMLICFGVSWPFSIYKMLKTRHCEGKSFIFLILVMIGYVLGVIHKLFYNLDVVVLLYGFLFFVVLTDFFMCLYITHQNKANH